MGANQADRFDAWLEQELSQATAEAGPHPLPSQAHYQAASLRPGGLLGSDRFATATAVALVAVVTAGAAVEAAVTRSADPGSWGHQVVQQIQKCTNALAPGSHGLGECVSAFTSENSDRVHSPNAAHVTQSRPVAPAANQTGDAVSSPAPAGSDSAPTAQPSAAPAGRDAGQGDSDIGGSDSGKRGGGDHDGKPSKPHGPKSEPK